MNRINHPNLKQLSHSSVVLAHSCPRKYQLTKILYKAKENSIHFDFGHAVGLGIQVYMITGSVDKAYFAIFSKWGIDLDNEDGAKAGKTFWDALVAVDNFVSVASMYFGNMEVVSINGVPAAELGFRIDFGNDFYYRGFVDLVLWDRANNCFVVVEIKTTGSNYVNESMYKNSGQGTGYKVVLDSIAKLYPQYAKSASYYIYYPVYRTRQQEWDVLIFPKSATPLAMWLKNIKTDIAMLNLYAEQDFYPMHGESCTNFGKDCKFFGLCEMKTESLLGSEVELEIEDPKKYQFHLSAEQLIQDQLDLIKEGV